MKTKIIAVLMLIAATSCIEAHDLVPAQKDSKLNLRRQAARDLADVEERLKELGGENMTIAIEAAHRPAGEYYQLLVEQCGCPLEYELPSDVRPTEWSGLCLKKASDCGVAFHKLERVDGQLRGRPVGHLGGFSVDAHVTGARTVADCMPLSAEERLSAGVAQAPQITRLHCVPRLQQLLIRAMLENGFCVGLAGKNLREPWHFEHIHTARAIGGKVSNFCTTDLNDPNLQKLVLIHPHGSDCVRLREKNYGSCMMGAPAYDNMLDEPSRAWLRHKYACEMQADELSRGCIARPDLFLKKE